MKIGIRDHNYPNGFFTVYTGHCIKRTGGLNRRFKGYDHAHGELTHKIHKMGMSSFPNPSFEFSDDYIKNSDLPNITDMTKADGDRLDQMRINYEIRKSLDPHYKL